MAARDGRDSIPYDELVALPYLEAVCRETLRLYSPLTTINRKYKLPLTSVTNILTYHNIELHKTL